MPILNSQMGELISNLVSDANDEDDENVNLDKLINSSLSEQFSQLHSGVGGHIDLDFFNRMRNLSKEKDSTDYEYSDFVIDRKPEKKESTSKEKTQSKEKKVKVKKPKVPASFIDPLTGFPIPSWVPEGISAKDSNLLANLGEHN